MLRRAKKRNIENKPSNSDKHLKKEEVSESLLDNEKLLEDVVFGGLLEIESENIPEQKVSIKHEAVWSDDDDCEVLPHGSSLNINVSSRKNQFEKALGPTPQWAEVSSKVDYETLPSKYLAKASMNLPKKSIDIIQCVDLNKKQVSKRPLKACEFHRSTQIAMTASQDCCLNLFQIDGKNNAKIHGLFMENFPIQCAHFLSTDTEILFTSKCHWMYNFDMISGKVVKVPYIKGLNKTIISSFKVSPNGKHLLFLSKFGKMHLIDSSTKEHITTLKMNGSVEDVAFSQDGRYMLSFGDEGVVNVWDMDVRQCVHTFEDEGCVKGTSIAVSPDLNRIACGSFSGIVNLYGNDCLLSSKPTVLKSLMNLKTPATSLKFNSSSEILAMSSNVIKNAVKLAHMSSFNVFSNFPEVKHSIGTTLQVGFSPNSGYFHVATASGRAHLFRLNHYQNY